MKRESLSRYLDFITQTAYLAGRLTLSYFNTMVEVEVKPDNTPVTQADRQTESFIRNQIEKTYPRHTIVGEEFGEKDSQGASHRWIIDPIDGTKSFVCGVPLYAVLIALEIEGKVQAGAAYFPALDEMVAAANGLGCWWNGRRAQVSKLTRFDQAVVSFTNLKNFAKYGREEAWNRIIQASYFQAGWGDAYGYMLVATGRIEAMLDPAMEVWDCAPFPPILSEAGGYFGDWQGNPTVYGKEGLATTKVLLPEVLDLIS